MRTWKGTLLTLTVALASCVLLLSGRGSAQTNSETDDASVASARAVEASSASAQAYVGTCKPGTKPGTTAFASIQRAVTSVPAGATINICPGTYNEQVIITQPLTLQGMQSNNSASVIIGATGVTLVPFQSSAIYGGAVGQLEVLNPDGPVNISGVVVDGSTISYSGVNFGWAAGIIFDSSLGTLDHVVAQNLPQQQPWTLYEAGILILDDNSISPTVSVKSSEVNQPIEMGIFVPSGNINLNVTKSHFSLASYGIADWSTGTSRLSGNTVINAYDGIYGFGSTSINGNTIINSNVGVIDWPASGDDVGDMSADITGNTLVNNAVGIWNFIPNAKIKSNKIFGGPGPSNNTSGVSDGIALQCTPADVGGNTIVNTSIAVVSGAPGSSFNPGNSFFGDPVIQQPCP